MSTHTTTPIRRGRATRPRIPGHPLRDPRREYLAAHVAAGAAIRDAYTGAGYTGDPDAGHGEALCREPQVAERIAELVQARSTAIVAAAPKPVGLPTSEEWAAERVRLAREAWAAGAWSAAVTAYEHLSKVLPGTKEPDNDTPQVVAGMIVSALLHQDKGQDRTRHVAALLAECPALWTQLQVAVHGYRQGDDTIDNAPSS